MGAGAGIINQDACSSCSTRDLRENLSGKPLMGSTKGPNWIPLSESTIDHLI